MGTTITMITAAAADTTISIMRERTAGSSLLKLAAWLSPTFPVGSFSYSHGLERAVEDGLVTNAASLSQWIEALLLRGSGWNDAIVLAEAWRQANDGVAPVETAALAQALAGSAERHMESTLQGGAFLKAASSWPHALVAELPDDCPYAVAVGAVAGAHGVPLEETLSLFLQAFASNLLQAAIRLGVLGQSQSVELLARLEPALLDVAQRAAASTLDDLGSSTINSEIAAMNHETQTARLFRS
jgi:urease accessory protein